VAEPVHPAHAPHASHAHASHHAHHAKHGRGSRPEAGSRGRDSTATVAIVVGLALVVGLGAIVATRGRSETPAESVAATKPAPAPADTGTDASQPVPDAPSSVRPPAIDRESDKTDEEPPAAIELPPPPPSAPALDPEPAAAEDPVAPGGEYRPPPPSAEPSAQPIPRPAEPDAPPAEPASPERRDSGQPDSPKETPAAPVVATATPREIVEQWPNGKVKTKYHVDKTGKKEGAYAAFHESGKAAVRATYKADELNGWYEEFHPNGKPKAKRSYKKGVLHGRSVEFDEKGHLLGDLMFFEGRVASTKTPEQISAALAAIEAGKVATPSGKQRLADAAPYDWDREAKAVRRLRAYRYLCDLPTDVDLDFTQAEAAAAGARLLEAIGHLDHTPGKPPGMADELYKLGYEGTSHGNLSQGLTEASAAVDGWMDDGDESNWRRVGHRRWCLDPSMKHTAFAISGQMGVMYAHDGAGKTAPQIADGMVCYPARGYFPASFFHHGSPWCVCLDPRRYGKPDQVKVVVRPADEKLRKGQPVAVPDVVVENGGYGSFTYCVIFRPDFPTGPGARCWVTLEGVRDPAGADAHVEYFVEFFQR
jgi:hypothetical protein